MSIMNRRQLIGKGAAVAASIAASRIATDHDVTSGVGAISLPPRWNRTTTFVYTGTLQMDPAVISDAAMWDAGWDMAEHREWQSDRTPNDSIPGTWLSCPGDDDIVRALKEPVPLAIAYHDLCAGMGIPVPDYVQQAYDELRPLVFK